MKLHDVKHLEEYVTNWRVPALVKMSIAPMAYRMIVIQQVLMNVIQRLTFIFYVSHQIAFVICRPGCQSIL